MYESYFGITEKPFSIAPDPRFVFLSAAHEEALAHLTYGITEPGGFVMLTGEVGTGKTTLLRTLLQQLPDNVDLALVLNPKLSPVEFLATLCDELHIPLTSQSPSLKTLVDALNAHLLKSFAAGRRTVLLIDEAQGLSPDVLEQVRLLTNLETTREKLLEIILVGQPELRDTLARTDLRQLAQRITARFHLKPLSRREVKAYVRHRLGVVGAPAGLFTEGALARLAQISGGIPRLINEVADRAMLGAFAAERRSIDRRLVSRAAREVFGEPQRRRWPLTTAMAVGLAALIGLGVYWVHRAGLGIHNIEDWAASLSSEPQQPILVTIQAPPANAEAPAQAQEAAPEALLRADELAPQTEPVVPFSLGGADAAWSLLFNAWAANYDPALGDPCQQAADQGLQCLAGVGGWLELATLDRPALLRLDMPEGEVFAVLLGFDGDRAIVAGESGEIRRHKEALNPYWAKDYILLWRSPDTTERPTLAAGDRGPDVLWLRDRLAEVGAVVEPEADPAYFDARLEELVRSFQLANGLEPDGIVGSQTRLRLDLLLPSDQEPRLSGGF